MASTGPSHGAHAPAAPLVTLQRARRAACMAAVVVALLGLTVLAGWVLDLPLLRSVLPGAAHTKANTALGMVGGAIALLLCTLPGPSAGRTLGRVLAVAVALLGLATLAEHLFSWNPGLDEWLLPDTSSAFNPAKGRMSPFSAAAFVALGCAIACLPEPRATWLARTAGGLAAAIGVVSIAGYLGNVTTLVTDRMASPVTVHAAIGFILLGVATYLLASAQHAEATSRTRSRLETLAMGGFIPAWLFVVVAGGFSSTTGANFADTVHLVAHTQEVRAELGKVYGLIADAELARHDRLLTLEAFPGVDVDAWSRELRANLQRLRTLLSDNPEQLERLQRLEDLVKMHAQALQGSATAPAPDASTQEQHRVDERSLRQIRTVVHQMDQAEATLLETRLRVSQRQRNFALAGLLATLVVLSGLFVLLLRGIRKEAVARDAADERIQRLNAELEGRVRERTTQLEFQQAFLRRVIDLNRNLIFAKDTEGRFVLANVAMAQAYGTTPRDLVGRSEHDFNPDTQQVQQFHAADLQVIHSGQDLEIPAEPLTLASGEVRWYTTVKRPMQAVDGQTTILLGVATDITERKLAEDGLRDMATHLERRVAERTLELQATNAQLEQARAQADAASRAKSAFLANMSHEIRTPMNAIIGLTHLMTRGTQEGLQRERLDKIGGAAQHLLQVINDILDISKIEAGKLTLDDAEFSLEELMGRAIALVASQARGKGLELILDEDHLPDRLRGDPTRLSQILINLLSNAVKFTEHGWVRLRGAVLEEDAQQLLLRFEVQDTGPGISQERQALLFASFEQADNSSSRRHGGTGLGLALSRQLARAMGGEAGVVSAPGAGSQFWFTVRLQRAPEAGRKPAPVLLEGLRALLVDDLPEARAVIGERLRTMGMEVDTADSGVAAVRKVEAELARRRAYDVMLIDWRMEPLDGIETLARLRAVLGDGMPPSILVTAFDEVTLGERARRAGFDAVLPKPITPSTLQDQLAVLLQAPREAEDSRPSEISGTEALVKARHAGQRILLAEDNPVNREVAQALLEQADLVVETAWDGGRAVELALSRRYDLVMMDVQMPDMDGLEATRAIRQRLGQALPIIAMTANAFMDDRQACLEAGMNDHVAKPVNPEVMYATLLRWLPLRASEADRLPEAPPTTPAELERLPLPDRLATIDGYDVEMALRSVSGQVPILERVVRRFVATYTQGLPELLDEDGTDAEVITRWHKACHSVRGALSTLGASRLLGGLVEFERRLAAAESPRALRADAAALHAQMLALVKLLAEQL